MKLVAAANLKKDGRVLGICMNTPACSVAPTEVPVLAQMWAMELANLSFS